VIVWAKTWVLGVIFSVACVSHIAFVRSREIHIEEIEVSYNSAMRLRILNAVNYEKERTSAVFCCVRTLAMRRPTWLLQMWAGS
jgi:hypothetical protein